MERPPGKNSSAADTRGGVEAGALLFSLTLPTPRETALLHIYSTVSYSLTALCVDTEGGFTCPYATWITALSKQIPRYPYRKG